VRRLPQTLVNVRVLRQSWQVGRLEGEVHTAHYEWTFVWDFRRGQLAIEPSKGRALIKEPLGRFLEAKDYQLEPGGDYEFTIRGEV
jgi:hypothetical protein